MMFGSNEGRQGAGASEKGSAADALLFEKYLGTFELE
jgi:hypothetical protein